MNAVDISPQRIERIREKMRKFEEWIDTKRDKRGWASYHPADIPPHLETVSNAERAAVELHDWMAYPPKRYFLYVDPRRRVATTWTGLVLGTVSLGRMFKSNFGDRRIPIDVHGNNGVEYFGVYYCSAGDYARITAKGPYEYLCTR